MKNQIYYITDRYGQRLSAVLPIHFFEELMECYDEHREEFKNRKAAAEEQSIITQAKKELNLLVNEYEVEMSRNSNSEKYQNTDKNSSFNVRPENFNSQTHMSSVRESDYQDSSSLQMMRSRSDQLVAESGKDLVKDDVVLDEHKALDKILYYRSGEASASGYLTVHGGRYGFFMLKGSTIKRTKANTVRGSAVKLIEILISNGKLVEEGNLYRFVHNTEIQSCSLAASLVAGNNRGMINTWRDDDGHTLDYYGFSKHKNQTIADESEG